MRIFVALSCCVVLVLFACNKDSNSLAPNGLANLTLAGKITSGTGSFLGAQEYQFTTQFDKSNHFQTKNKSGLIESIGEYSYQKIDARTGKIILRATSDIHAGEELQITLKFTSSDSGAYEGHFLKGGSGEQSGVFDLK